jgi:hypothetical protein
VQETAPRRACGPVPQMMLPLGVSKNAAEAEDGAIMAIVRALTANPPLNLRLPNTGGPQLDREGPEPETAGETQPRARINPCLPAVAVAVAQPPERRSRTSARDECRAGARGGAVVGGALPLAVGASMSPAPPAQPVQPGVVVGAERMRSRAVSVRCAPWACSPRRRPRTGGRGCWRRTRSRPRRLRTQ